MLKEVVMAFSSLLVGLCNDRAQERQHFDRRRIPASFFSRFSNSVNTRACHIRAMGSKKYDFGDLRGKMSIVKTMCHQSMFESLTLPANAIPGPELPAWKMTGVRCRLGSQMCGPGTLG